jgi:hypothetical protein
LISIRIAGWKKLWPDDAEDVVMLEVDADPFGQDDDDEDCGVDVDAIIESARKLQLNVDDRDISEMLAEEPLDFTTEELLDIAKEREKKERARTQPPEGRLATLKTSEIKLGMARFAENAEFLRPLLKDKEEEVTHLVKILDDICMHACRQELKRRETQTTLDRFVSF